jgi:hypothetical protein
MEWHSHSHIKQNFFVLQKLNEKNSWNYDLIDHMGKLIKDENRGVNFQKVDDYYFPRISIITTITQFCTG